MSITNTENERLDLNTPLQSLMRIVSSAAMDKKNGKKLMHQLSAAQTRYNDDKLNLAIIGEFSCGKSTFLNSLLNREILATKMQPTTAVPTYITWDNPDASFDITVYDAKGTPIPLSRQEGRERFTEMTGLQLPDSDEKMIDAVTTNNELDGIVTKVVIKAPADEHYAGICLIDTPGVNPGAEETAGHVLKTQEVLRDNADAAIIMFPSERVYTNSFKEFLEENMSHLLKRSIFVITKSDKIKEPDMLDEMRDFVAGNLKNIQVEAPEIYCISASRALDAVLDGDNARPEDIAWKEQFDETISKIFASMASRRSAIVRENAMSVAKTITESLTQKLMADQKELEKKDNYLKQNSPECMKEDCEKIISECTRRMKRLYDQYVSQKDTMAKGAVDYAISDACSDIDAKNDKSAVADYLKYYGSTGANLINRKVKESLTSFSDALRSEMKECHEKIVACYQRYHLNISGAEVSLPLQDDPLSTSVTNGVGVNSMGEIYTGGQFLDNAKDMIEGIFDSDNIFEGAFMVGATVIMAPFELLKLIGSWLRSLESVQTEAKQKLTGNLQQYTEPVKNNLGSCLEKIHSGYREAVKNIPGKIIEQFSQEFNRVKSQYDKDMAETQREIANTEANLNELASVSAQLAPKEKPKEMPMEGRDTSNSLLSKGMQALKSMFMKFKKNKQ